MYVCMYVHVCMFMYVLTVKIHKRYIDQLLMLQGYSSFGQVLRVLGSLRFRALVGKRAGRLGLGFRV